MKYLAFALALFMFLGLSAGAATKTYIENFDSDWQIDPNYSGAKITGGRAYVADNASSSRLESSNFGSTFGYDVERVKLTATDSRPSGSIIYYVSNDGGKTWAQASLSGWTTFSKLGNTLRWAVVLAGPSGNEGPSIDSLTIEYELGGERAKSSNDDRRVMDLRQVADAVDNFYRDNGFYPNINAGSAELRWKQLGDLLTRANRSGSSYIFSMPQPIVSVSGKVIDYDYKYLGNGYVIFSSLESATHYELGYDSDFILNQVNCADPVFCIVKGDVSTNIATENAITKPAVNYRLIRAVGDTKVYYITRNGYKRHVPSPEVFLSYGNKWSDVVTIDPNILNNYPDNNLIYLEGEKQRVFSLGYKVKSFVSSVAAKRMSINLNNAAPVNRTEFNYYEITKPL